MRRVSSRQRLVSWDAFDASATTYENHDDDEYYHYNGDGDDNDEDYDSSSEYITCYDESNMSRGHPSFASLSTFSLDNNDDDVEEAKLLSSSNHGNNNNNCRKRDRSTRNNSGIIKKCLSSSFNSSNNDNNNIRHGFGINTLETPQQVLPPNTIDIIPAFSNEINPNTNNNKKKNSSSGLLQDLICMDDVKLHILSFVSMSDARSMLSTCQQFYHLLKISKESYSLWMEYYNQLWPTTTSTTTRPTSIDIKDDLELPIATSALQTSSSCDNSTTTTINSTNLSVLLGMAGKTQPTDIDESQFVPSNRVYFLRRGREVDLMIRIAASARQREGPTMQFKTCCIATSSSGNDNENDENVKVIQYTGPVGPGDRCIISNQPFPKPKFIKPLRKYSFDSSSSSSSQTSMGDMNSPPLLSGGDEEITMPYVNVNTHNYHSPFGNFFCRNSSDGNTSSSGGEEGPTITPNNAIWRPFVVPYVTKCNPKTGCKEVNLTPRLVAYYEVTIHPKSILSEGDEEEQEQSHHSSDDDEDDDDPRHPVWLLNPTHQRGGNTTTDCVAVGISSNGFHLHSKMPGWDTKSYGYHGDDGGLFHGSGTMVRAFGPKFGCGDTVGCGIDYVTGGIFFTLNGSFLGYGWSNVDPDYLQKNDLYPTIGVDTNCPLEVNFGNEKPFKFELKKFIKRQKDIVECCLSPLLIGCYNNNDSSSHDSDDNTDTDHDDESMNCCKLSPSSSLRKSKGKNVNDTTTTTTTTTTSSLSPPRIRRPRLFHNSSREI